MNTQVVIQIGKYLDDIIRSECVTEQRIFGETLCFFLNEILDKSFTERQLIANRSVIMMRRMGVYPVKNGEFYLRSIGENEIIDWREKSNHGEMPTPSATN